MASALGSTVVVASKWSSPLPKARHVGNSSIDSFCRSPYFHTTRSLHFNRRTKLNPLRASASKPSEEKNEASSLLEGTDDSYRFTNLSSSSSSSSNSSSIEQSEKSISDANSPNLAYSSVNVDEPISNLPSFNFWLNSALATAGIMDTAYLTYEKLTGGSVFCPLDGSSCNDVLNSGYGSLFGLPLSLFGLVAYSAVPVLSYFSKSFNDREVKEGDLASLRGYAKWLLLGLTSVMTSASAYFIYIMSFELNDFCPYCVLSAILSSLLLFSSLQAFKGSEIKKSVLPQTGVIVFSTVLSLSLAFSNARFALARVSDYYLPYSKPIIETVSTSSEIALAKHLSKIGAKMYGAFWCSHCNDQKRAFGAEATKYLGYVECFPEGISSNTKMDADCLDKNIKGFPTWIINDVALPGEQDLQFLAEVSGFNPEN